MATNKTYKGAFKPMGKSGHFDESMRHSLQAKGFKTGNLSAGGLGVVPPKSKGRLVVVKYRVYHFDDLPEKAKEKALENYRDINVDFNWWDYDGQLDLSEQEMKDAGIKMAEYPDTMVSYDPKKMEFDLDRYMYLQYHDLEVKDKNVFRKWLGIPEKLWNKVDFHFDNNRERNTSIDFSSDKELTPPEQVILDKARDKWNAKVFQAWKDLKGEYERRLSDEEIAESFRANEYEFNEEGKIN